MQAHVLDGFRVEDGKEPKGVRGIVEGDLVEQDLGLVGAAAPYVETTADVGGCLDAREELQAAQQIRFPDGGQLFQYRGLEGDEPGLRKPLVAEGAEGRAVQEHVGGKQVLAAVAVRDESADRGGLRRGGNQQQGKQYSEELHRCRSDLHQVRRFEYTT